MSRTKLGLPNIMSDREKELRGEVMKKQTFWAACDCGGEYIAEAPGIKGLIVVGTCSCGKRIRMKIPDMEEGFRTLQQNVLDIYNTTLRVFSEYAPPLTVRQVCYQLEARGVIPKSEKGFNNAMVHLKQMRFKGVIPFSHFSDTSRFKLDGGAKFDNAEDFMLRAHQYYKRDMWASQNSYVEIWIEKDALRSVFLPITSEYDVPLMIAKGYPSLTFIKEAAETINRKTEQGKRAFIYHFGDNDPSGVDASRMVENDLKLLCEGITFERVAITEEQIRRYNIQTRPTKKTDTRSKKWQGDSCELDALSPNVLRDLIRDCIERHISISELNWNNRIEAEEIRKMAEFNSNFRGSGYESG